MSKTENTGCQWWSNHLIFSSNPQICITFPFLSHLSPSYKRRWYHHPLHHVLLAMPSSPPTWRTSRRPCRQHWGPRYPTPRHSAGPPRLARHAWSTENPTQRPAMNLDILVVCHYVVYNIYIYVCVCVRVCVYIYINIYICKYLHVHVTTQSNSLSVLHLFASMLKSELVKQPWCLIAKKTFMDQTNWELLEFVWQESGESFHAMHPVGPSTHLSRQGSAIATLSPWRWWRQSWIPNPVDVQFQMPRVLPTCKSAKTGLKLKQNYTTWISSLFNRTYKLPATCKKLCGFERSSVYGTVMPGWPGWTQHMVKHHNTTHRTCHKYCREQNQTTKTRTDSKKHLKFKTTYKKQPQVDAQAPSTSFLINARQIVFCHLRGPLPLHGLTTSHRHTATCQRIRAQQPCHKCRQGDVGSTCPGQSHTKRTPGSMVQA